jgi:hypothetical protein
MAHQVRAVEDQVCVTAVSFAIADGKVMIRRLSAGIGPLNGGELRPKKTVTPAGSTSIGRRTGTDPRWCHLPVNRCVGEPIGEHLRCVLVRRRR